MSYYTLQGSKCRAEDRNSRSLRYIAARKREISIGEYYKAGVWLDGTLGGCYLDGKGILEVVCVDGKKRTLSLKPEGKVLISQIAMERLRATSAREVFKEEINSESYL